MSSVGVVCALCRSTPRTPALRKRQKRLYGERCSSERLIIQRILHRRNLSLDSIAELKNPNAILCLSCQKSLLKLRRLEQDMMSTVAEIDLKINLHCGQQFCEHCYIARHYL